MCPNDIHFRWKIGSVAAIIPIALISVLFSHVSDVIVLEIYETETENGNSHFVPDYLNQSRKSMIDKGYFREELW